MHAHYIVRLTSDERETLERLISGGTKQARKIKRAQVLLATDRGVSDVEIATAINCGTATVYRVKKAFVEEGLEQALNEKPRPGAKRKLSGREETLLVALACSAPPLGRSRWTLQLLADEFVQLECVELESVSADTVGRRLAEKDIKPWQKKMWCIPAVDAEFVERMENVLDLYAEPHDPVRPIICFDEKPYQLIGETRVPIPMKPGQPKRVDYEFPRNGVANIFMMVGAAFPWRQTKVTPACRRNRATRRRAMRDGDPICGDGKLDAPEACDDGNTQPGDGIRLRRGPAVDPARR